MSKLPLYLALALPCLIAACGSEPADATSGPSNSPQGGAARVQEAGLLPHVSVESKPVEAAEPDAPMTIASLVPEGSTVWIRVSSFEELSELVDEFLGASGIAMDFDRLLRMTPVAESLDSIDQTREIGLALSFPEGGETKVTLMLPVLDRGAVIQALRELPDAPQCFGLDDYVVATTLDEYRPGLGSIELTDGLPQGQVALRVNLEEIMEELGPMVELALGQISETTTPGLDGASATLVDAARKAIESAESLDLALNLEDGELDLSMAFVAAPNSALDGLLPRGTGDLTSLARCLQDDDAMSMLVAVDSNTVQDLLMPLYARMIDTAAERGGVDASVQSLMLEWGSLWPLLGDSVVASVETEGDFSATYYFQPSDFEAFSRSFDAVVRSLPRNAPGVAVSGPEQGVSETIYRLAFADSEPGSLLGAMSSNGQLSVRLAQLQDIAVVTVGTNDGAMNTALSRVTRQDRQVPENIRYAIDRIGGANPAFVARVDLSALARDLAYEVEGLELDGAALAAEPLNLTYYGGVDGRYWRFGVRTDISKLGALGSK